MYFALMDIQRANADLFFRLTSKSIDAFETVMATTFDAMRSMVSVAHRDSLGVLNNRRQEEKVTEQLTSNLPSPQTAVTYTRQLFDIASDVQGEVARWSQEQIEAQRERMRTWADQVEKVSGSAAQAVEQFSEKMQQTAQESSDIAERSAREAAAASQTMNKSARRAAKHGHAASKH
jgi:Phasin protein